MPPLIFWVIVPLSHDAHGDGLGPGLAVHEVQGQVRRAGGGEVLAELHGRLGLTGHPVLR